jgi:hypothetical protein
MRNATRIKRSKKESEMDEKNTSGMTFTNTSSMTFAKVFLNELTGKAQFADQITYIEKHGKAVAAIVPVRDAVRLEQLKASEKKREK